MHGKRKSGVFFAVRAGFQVSFLEISQRRHVRDVITTLLRTSYNNRACLNFAVTGSRILLHPLRSTRRGKLSRKIALNSNGEVNCRELARRPCPIYAAVCSISTKLLSKLWSIYFRFSYLLSLTVNSLNSSSSEDLKFLRYMVLLWNVNNLLSTSRDKSVNILNILSTKAKTFCPEQLEIKCNFTPCNTIAHTIIADNKDNVTSIS